ncbi:hypothetical protein Nepgr_017172 [Nepenthes gracilis]|uniref:Uncharacterized protein n=1 Tax=Nepenthes gracilis TaxID=150966 RepID=A0AAD3XT19_NEPGR|nr:hypothetical protein Nepgr_017172 [Nepenthes gracilis]
MAAVLYFKQSGTCALVDDGLLTLLATLRVFPGALFTTIESSHVCFVFWWTTLGAAYSIGLATGLHTFVQHLAPPITQFTLKGHW